MWNGFSTNLKDFCYVLQYKLASYYVNSEVEVQKPQTLPDI